MRNPRKRKKNEREEYNKWIDRDSERRRNQREGMTKRENVRERERES